MCVSNPENGKGMAYLKIQLQHGFQGRLCKKVLRTLNAKLKAQVYLDCTEEQWMYCKQAATRFDSHWYPSDGSREDLIKGRLE